ncbi:glucosaminidase domain-containing protein [Portibacter marinus]|uniref:glucosaminidase domain-containing protein n=1 Tax=Portibacter marinus TaxID=2898660 RepID=UPI001F373CC0|nr:glucosaminidase domain-containing protein [Portibacter marinus]
MSKSIVILLTLTLTYNLKANDNKTGTRAYVDAFVEIAVSEMKRTGIPASIKLAQAILESNSGKSEMAMMANNHFGIKCGNDWRGASYYKIDDDRNHRGQLIESCFRVFKDAEESFIEHSNFLQNRGKASRYDFLFEYDSKDYVKWARGLKKAGYATDPHYAQKLINLIEKYELHRYDRLGHSGRDHIATEPTDQNVHQQEDKNTKIKPSAKEEAVAGPTSIKMPRHKVVNESKMIVTQGGETLNDISNASGIPLQSLVEFNDGTIAPYASLAPKTSVFLEKKRLSLKGKKKFHQVRKDETMAEIAQHYGIDLESLYIRNRIPFGSEVETGEKVQLKGLMRTGSKPKLSKKGQAGLVKKSRFVEETVEYIFSPKNGN